MLPGGHKLEPLQTLTKKLAEYRPGEDTKPLRDAHRLLVSNCAARAADDPEAATGVEQAHDVALVAADLSLDLDSIVCALLHGEAQRDPAFLDAHREELGPEVSTLLDGLVKLLALPFDQAAEQAAESLRRMIVSIARDLRSVLLMLCCRLVEMRRLTKHEPEELRSRLGRETSQVHAPLANRLGISWMKSEMEDLAFKHGHPADYSSLAESVDGSRDERQAYISRVQGIIHKTLADNGLQIEVAGRSKHLYSVHRKMLRDRLDLEQIHDLAAFRVLTDIREECYQALGVVHQTWPHVPGRFKDYIAMPKANGYQSLHTTVLGPESKRMEVQIRTREMHQIAKNGVAAHWLYKEGRRGACPRDVQRFTWLRSILDQQVDSLHIKDLVEEYPDELYQNEVYVFTPRGDVKELPKGATALDFAYAVHSEVGNHCSGALVNGRIVPLRYELQNGDILEIRTTNSARPSRNWLKVATTSRARSKIRRELRELERENAESMGREILERELPRTSPSLNRLLKDGKLLEAAKALNYRETDDLLAGIGFGRTTANQVISKLYPQERESDAERQERLERAESAKPSEERSTSGRGLLVGGESGILVRYARCCQPLPGDSITGYITRGHGITVHKLSCPRAQETNSLRHVEVEWQQSIDQRFDVTLRVDTADKPGVLAALSRVFADTNTNITAARTERTGDGAMVYFDVEVETTSQLRKVMASLRTLRIVRRVDRLLT